MVLQVAVEPGSYKVGPPSMPWRLPTNAPSTTVDPHLQLDTIEWVTKERGATQLLALLIKIDSSDAK